MSDFAAKLADRARPLIIAEIAQAHDGSLGAAHAYVDALADAGADAIKFQTHIADQESTLDEQFRVRFSYQDDTRYGYWQRMEFTEPQWAELKRHAEDRGIAFLSTPFSRAAVDMLSRLDVAAWKIGSGDTALPELLEPMADSGKPMIVSSGMSDWAELDRVVDRLRERNADFTLMQCTSQYPTPLENVGLNNLPLIAERYGCRVGLSDHTGTLSPSLAAIARGYPLIEVHAIFDKRMFGPDTIASLTVDQIGELARFARDVATLDSHPVSKDAMADTLSQQKALFGRSVGLAQDLPAGHVLEASDLLPKKPSGGVPWDRKDDVVGRTLTKDVARNRLLRNEDLK